MATDAQIRRFMTLFRGNDRSFGRWFPQEAVRARQVQTEKATYTEAEFRQHLSGSVGIGIVPIRDDGTCYWGAIDIDNHGSDHDLDISAIEMKIHEQSLPLVVCRSKSGGVHLFLFGSEPLRADLVRRVLLRWAAELGIEGTDCVFPKQPRLTVNDEGQRALGNWINLPYFDADNTARYAVENGKPVSLDQFCTAAEGKAITPADLSRLFNAEHSEAPPCLEAKIRSGGFAAGERNQGVYLITVYCRKKDPESAREAAHDLVVELMADNPLPFKERDKTIRSALNKRYNYQCELWRDVCDKEACRKRRFGISEAEFESMRLRDGMPTFVDLVQYHNTEPTLYDLSLGLGEGREALRITRLTIDHLSDFLALRKVIMNQAKVVLPRLKATEWDTTLRDLFAKVRLEEAPEETTVEGVLHTRLHEFVRKADFKSPGDDTKDRAALLRGAPVVQVFHGQRVVMFRHVDFQSYLQKTKTDVGRDLWFRVSNKLGVQHDRVRVGKYVIGVWYLPIEDEQSEEQRPHDFNPEF